jgi:glycolate oxidase
MRRRAPSVRDPLVAELVDALAPDRVDQNDLARRLFSRDASVITGGRTGVVCFPTSTAEVQACVRIARAHGRAVVPRGSGTGLAGGAVPCDQPIVVVTTKMQRILEVDVANRVAWVEPGVINLDLTRALAPYGFHFAPDPSSQQSCSIGGNLANNSGGPHCLAYGVTSAHIVAAEVVLADGSVAMLGDLDAEPAGYDLRGIFVGSEGTMGIATRIAVRLTPNPPALCTLLLDFTTVRDAATAVSGIIAEGCWWRSTDSPAASRSSAPSSSASGAPTTLVPCASRRTTPSARCCGRGARPRSARSRASSRTTTCTTP